jgi:hypothetical protein
MRCGNRNVLASALTERTGVRWGEWEFASIKFTFARSHCRSRRRGGGRRAFDRIRATTRTFTFTGEHEDPLNFTAGANNEPLSWTCNGPASALSVHLLAFCSTHCRRTDSIQSDNSPLAFPVGSACDCSMDSGALSRIHRYSRQ